MKISVLTATFNRDKVLKKLYDSLKENYLVFKDFEWIIIDDGSTDDTNKTVAKWIKEASFEIKYIFQENAGKMQAINNGCKHISGEVMLEVDSDDYLTNNALKIINDDFLNLKDNVYGILYRKELINKNVSKDDALNNKIIKLFDLHNKYNLDYDMAIVFKSEVRKKYFYELIEDEKFITEARLYYKLDQLYDGLLIKNDVIMVCEYMEDGYSNNIKDIFKKYPKGYYEFFKECLNYVNKDTISSKRMYFIKHYILFGYLNKKKKRELIKNVTGYNKLLVSLLVIPGYMKARKF